MTRLSDRKIVIVTRKTRIEELVFRYNTLEQARFYIEHLGADFSDYLVEDRQYKIVVAEVENQAMELGRVQLLDRAYLPNFIFGPEDLVVAVGQDGLVANTVKYLSNQAIIGVNPDPDRWDGVLLPFSGKDAGRIIRDVLEGKRRTAEITLAQAALTNGQKLYAVNDLFIGPKSHVSARYSLECGGEGETQSSSGVIVSTGLGSTGWLKSILAGARALTRLAGDSPDDACAKNDDGRFPWSADYLLYSVREPFPSQTTGARMAFGRIEADKPLTITSMMAAGGVIFSDGIESDFLEFNSGQKAIIQVADKKGRLVV